MSIKPVPCFTAVCDWHGCGADVMADSEYVGGDMTLVESALEDAEGDGWHAGRDGTSHYCDKHPTFWASDYENGEPFPSPPYLLIHDGDTDDSGDDGKVSLILPALEDPRQGSLLDGANR